MSLHNTNYSFTLEEIVFDVLLMCIPIAGIFCGFGLGLIDLQFAHSRTQGLVRIASATISHLIYITLLVL